MKSSSREKTKLIADLTPPETSPAAELVASNVDLLTQILLRIPAAKTLIRFKSVSKPWLSLLSDSRFASAHSHSHPNPNPPISSLYFYYIDNLDSVSLNGSLAFPFLSFLGRCLPGYFVIIHSCSGLLLVERPQFADDRYIVCNPTTQKFRLLTHPGGGYYTSGCLAFDPSKSPHYKVVLPRPASTPSLEIDIFSSETACWNKIFLLERCYRDGAFWNGAVYWLCDQYNLLRFDVETEKMIGIPYAESSSRILPIDKTRYFGECGHGGRLFLIQSPRVNSVEFEILEMDKDQCRWNVKFRVDLRPLLSAFPYISAFPDIAGNFYYSAVMCVVEGEKEDDLALLLAVPDNIVSYNLQKKTWNVLWESEQHSKEDDFWDPLQIPCDGRNCVFPFAESLSPV
ncbi:F-box protein At5g07610-like [Rhododendron vialii]|uniref:F-box protein At5g07610-like n=1 Tax=Rhododendron vialii TaxID=182163 RepID=UPI0026603B1F|nr:F-box protein At5g07610-like [Rhododendron vialii]